ncbi:MAG: hypothetical protein JO297_04930 [Nitrososphaeraceae archaeon]|nr:hypothetical protein [Nitrososphaeraceae archaeon]
MTNNAKLTSKQKRCRASIKTKDRVIKLTENNNGSSSLVCKRGKIDKNTNPPHSRSLVATSTKQSMSYVTVKGIESETSYLKRDWPIFILKELADNAYDFLNDHYANRSKDARVIAIRVMIDDGDDDAVTSGGSRDFFSMLRITVRNSNVDNIPVFEHLDQILDFTVWCSTKRDQHRETCGSLGDGLKRALGMGYASWADGIDDKDSFTDKQWDEPLIVRHNGKEYRAFIQVDKSSQNIWAKAHGPCEVSAEADAVAALGNYTEIEVTLPVPTSDRHVILARLEKYYKIYKIAKSNTYFSFGVEEKNKKGNYHK